MSSVTSRASTSASGWPQDVNSKSGTRQQNVTRPSQSPQLGLKQNHTITLHPTTEVEETIEHPSTARLEDHDLRSGNIPADIRQPGTNIDFQTQYFSYGNYLTPDQSSENPFSEQSSYASPSIDDLFWQEGFNTSQSLDDFDNDDTLVNNIFSEINQRGDLQGIVPKDLPNTSVDPRSSTPRLPTTTTTSQSLPSALQTTTSKHSTTSNMGVESNKRAHASDDEDDFQDDRFSRPTSNAIPSNNVQNPAQQMVKPTVLVSIYNRGDSPARTALPMVRSLSKRSQSSRLSDRGEATSTYENVPADTTNSGSRLMPPSQHDDADWAEDEDDDENNRAGVAPSSRNADTIPSINDMEKQHELDQTRVSVEHWLTVSETGTPSGADLDRTSARNRVRKDRIRSRSTGARTDPYGGPTLSDKHIPGPGVMLDVDSADDYSDDGSSFVSSDGQAENVPESPPANVDTMDPASEGSYFPPIEDLSIGPDEDEPLPRQFFRRGPWQDAPRVKDTVDVQGQPPTANHAIIQFGQQAANFDAASRRATWGTRRRSESEMGSIIDTTKARHQSITDKARDRGNSIINRARGVIRRNSSNRKKNKEKGNQSSPPLHPEGFVVAENDPSHTATSPIQQVQRTFSWGKSKSPPATHTGDAFMAMAGHLTVVGSNAGNSAEPPERSKSPFLSALKRSRSKSELPKTPKGTPGLSDLWNRHGGPPVPTLASPMQMPNTLPHSNSAPSADNANDDMDEDDEIPVKMELAVQADNIIPNLDGFRTHARQLNPRLEPYLVERISQDQLRRYKKLVKYKVEHTRNVQLKQHCESGSFCVALGGKPKILPPRTSAKDANVNYAQFKVGTGGDSDGEDAPFVEGVVTPALFPKGIPLPPTTHLPAEFECPLCFVVKKFQKPSDWTKHVHEDVQPFSCTFPNCPEPKSFKRKADWVRHENERHRHLEWWRCSIQECAHICYRKDNFVQHLVREHKMTEPKSKTQRSAGNRARPVVRSAQGLGHEPDDFWQLVERCRHDTTQTPKMEPCKFCGNICSSWKKLSVHVGKHMEQIAMPVLMLAEKRTITPDTVISPIDPPKCMQQPAMLDTTVLNGHHSHEALSPYSAVSAYQNSSAGQSPNPMHSNHSQASSHGQPFYDQGILPNGVHPMSGNIPHYSNGPAITSSYTYPPTYEVVSGPGYMPMPHQVNAFTQQQNSQGIQAPYHSQSVPRSQPMDASFGPLNVDTMQASMYGHDNYYPNSAPGNSYMGGFGNDVGHSDGLHSPHHRQASHLHSPAANAHNNGGEYLYPHQNGANGPPYY